jgi:hypothetical protein
MAVNGTIRDGKTIAAVLWLRQRLADGKKSRTSGK